MAHVPSIGRFVLATVAAVLVFVAPLGATQSNDPNLNATHAATTCPERVAHWPYGPSQAVAVDGDFAFFGVGTVLRIADVSSPGDPVVLADIPVGNLILDLEISGDLLVAALSESGVAAVDISDPGNPVLLDTLSLDDTANAVAIVGGHALVGGHSLVVVDLSVPSHLTVTGTLDSGIAWIRDIAVSGNTAVLADYNYGFHTVNIADTSSPTLLATHSDDLDRPVSVDVSGVYAYLMESHDDIVIFDISNPLVPSIVDRFATGGSWHTKLDIDADRLYAGRSGALMIYSISDPITLVELWDGSVGFTSPADLAAVGTNLFTAQGYAGLGIIDVSTPSAPQLIADSPAEHKMRQAALWDTYALTVAGTSFVIFDIADPTHPVEMTRFGGVNPNDVVVREGYAYAVNPTYFDIVDLRDPSTPESVATVTLGGFVLALTGDLAMIGGSSDGIRVVDISDPAAPAELALIDVDYTVSTIAASGPAVYVSENSIGLHIYDITVPSAPVEIGVIALPEIDNNNLAVGNGLLAVSEFSNGIRFFDVSSPLAPAETALYTGLTRWRSFAFSEDLFVVSGLYDDVDLHVLDLSDPTNPIHLGEAPLVFDAQAHVAALNGVALVTEEDTGFEVFDLGACALGLPAAGFSWFPAQPWVGKTVEFTDTSTGGITTWSWTFGDGDTSTLPDPSHVYTTAGTFSVELTVTGPLGSDAVTRSITITQDPPETPPIEQAGARQWVIPAAAHSPGAQGTNWVSDVVIHNPGSRTASANVYFMKGGQNNSGIGGRRVEIPAETSVALDDIVLDRFGWSNASGAILIGCDTTLRIASRTYNDASTGTFGQFIRGLPVSDAAGTGDAVRLIQLTRSATFRTNVGWANPGASPVNLEIDLVDARGASIGSHQSIIPPFGYGQANDILSGNIDDAMAVVSSASSGAMFFAYASVVDNSTGDPILILEGDTAAELYVPASAHVQGLAGTDWRTDLEIANPETREVVCSIDLLETGFANPTPRTLTVSVPGGSNVRVRDVLGALFDHDGSAALRLRSDGPGISATSSTFNTTSVGTYGQFISGTVSEMAISPTRSGRMIQLSQSAGNADGYRTNLGLLNVTDIEVEVHIELFDSDGTSVGSGDTVLLPFEHRQINRIFREVTPVAITNGFALVSTTTPKGAFLAYASVVDNRSGDPVYIPAWVE